MHIGREVSPSINIHHAPPLLQEVVIPNASSMRSVGADSTNFPIDYLSTAN